MREKLLFLGMLVMSILYCIEAIGNGSFEVINYIGFGIALITIIPWLISILVSVRKKNKEKELKKAMKEEKAKKEETSKKQ